ncbi:uncharacterized protein LACBIDRAFT_329052, partial [Laccaria bicolor S238N-H82]
ISRPSTRLKSNATNPATENLPNVGITNRNLDYANHIQRGCENDDSNAECPTTPSTTKAASRLGHCPIHSRKSDTNDGSGEFQHKRPRRDTHGRAWDGAPPGGKWWGWEARGSKSRLHRYFRFAILDCRLNALQYPPSGLQLDKGNSKESLSENMITTITNGRPVLCRLRFGWLSGPCQLNANART